MKQITSITAEPKHIFGVRLDDGTKITISLNFSDINRAWFLDFTYQGYTSTCHQVTNNPNIIRECQNLFPFGIGCSVSDGYEPWFIDDFMTGRAELYVLNADEVKQVEKEIYGKIL